jgi:hypothetical protein
MIFGASPLTPGGKRDTNWTGYSEGSTPMIGGRCRQLARGFARSGFRERAGAFRVIYVGTFAPGLRASRVPEEDAANGETGCGFGGVAAAGTGGEDVMTLGVFESVWDALEDTPTEAENMKLRSSLMIAIN